MQTRKHENTKEIIFFLVSSCLRGCIFGILAAHQALAAPPPVRTMYEDALAREQTVRAELTGDQPPPAVLKDVRAVVSDYQAVVRRHPASAYSDNALWQAGRLSLDAFARFGDGQDKDTALRLLRALATEYPTSKLTKEVPALLQAYQVPADSVLVQARESPLDPPARGGAPRRARRAGHGGFNDQTGRDHQKHPSCGVARRHPHHHRARPRGRVSR
jgi:hypothetical protein